MKSDKIEHLFEFLPKSKIKAAEGKETGRYPFYTSSEIQSKYINSFLYYPDCLIFGTGGKSSIHLAKNQFATSTDCIVITPKKNTSINIDYVFQYIKYNRKLLDNGFKGAGLKHISKAYISKIPIKYYENINHQIRTAYLLTKIELLIKQRKQNLQQLDDFIKSVFLDMFGDPLKNDKKWEKVALNNFGKVITGNTPPRKDESNYSVKYIEWIKTDNIIEELLYITKASEYLSETGILKARILTKGALLVTCIAGSISSIGRASLTNRKVCFNQQINAIQPNKDTNPFYLYALFKVQRKYVQSFANKGMKKIITKGEFEKIEMIKPPVDLQNQFGVIVEKVEIIKELYQQSLTELENLYGAVSQKAFKGELDLDKIPFIEASQTQKQVNIIDKEQDTQTITQSKPSFHLYPFLKGVDILTVKGRLELIKFWFEQSLKNTKKGNPLSIETFWQNAKFNFEPYRDKQLNIAEKNNKSDEVDAINNLNLGIQEYDFLKELIFEKLADGLLYQELSEVEKVELAQLTNENDLDTKNTIILKNNML
ncbi:restriction endonuclease subunit S [Gilliamella sp. B2717]|uniref:restriction endonuclease subunit S n=1 Tax=Gilliamella sp. B2717 TaxID=2817996 RepID=UPI00226A11D9|nr:restriction endonuclease subunit S [Gilliamella sp. B2717]MCX8579867.1 restriction endonuclease subunit S [Gilliamella sp. B2717]